MLLGQQPQWHDRDKNKCLTCPIREKNMFYPKENHSSCVMLKKITCDFPVIYQPASNHTPLLQLYNVPHNPIICYERYEIIRGAHYLSSHRICSYLFTEALVYYFYNIYKAQTIPNSIIYNLLFDNVRSLHGNHAPCHWTTPSILLVLLTSVLKHFTLVFTGEVLTMSTQK